MNTTDKIFLYFKEVIKPFKDRHVRKVDKKLQEELFDEIRKYLNHRSKKNEDN